MAENRREEGETVMMSMSKVACMAARVATAPRSAALLVAALVSVAVPAHAATNIQRIVSPSGIEAWLVREPSVPLIAIDFSFRGGSSQAPAGKAGLATLMADLLDEGAGEYDSRAFHE